MVEVIYVDLLSDGSIDLIHLETILNSSNKKALVSLMYINNEIGNILDVRNVSSLCKASDALFHSDSVQIPEEFFDLISYATTKIEC